MTFVDVVHFSDPGCPWAWSASPALAALRWRYSDQLRWRHVMIGLTESGDQYLERGYTPLRSARGYQRFRYHGMPFAPQVKAGVAGTSRACRAVVAVRLTEPEREWEAFRALQFMQFCSPGLLDRDEDIEVALRRVPGLDSQAIVDAIDSDEVVAAYEADRAEARTAEGTPADVQGKAAQSDGPVRYTAPSLIFETGGERLIAGGFQSLSAYDVLLANLAPELDRRPAPDDLADLWAEFPEGLTTGEVARIVATDNDPPDLEAAEAALLELMDAGGAERLSVGDGALWQPPGRLPEHESSSGRLTRSRLA